VRIEKSVMIQGENDYNNRAPVIINGCLTITGTERPRVELHDVQILGTTSGLNGGTCARARARFTGFDGHSHEQDFEGPLNVSALSVAGASLVGSNVLVRSAAHALDADHSYINLTDSNLAANPDSDIAIGLERSEAVFSDVAVAGGKTGVKALMLDRHAIRFDGVKILPARTQGGTLSVGEFGLDVAMVDEGLPGLPAAEAQSFSWSKGEIRGFKNGIVLHGGTGSQISEVSVVDPRVGIAVDAYATAILDSNKVERSSSVAIKLEKGAQGRAVSNSLTCVDGECVCYGGDCDDDDEDIKSGLFKLGGNTCHRDRRGRWF
jgi:hypothetical protein